MIKQIKEVVEGLRKKQNIEVEGIFTHFATDGVYDVSLGQPICKNSKNLHLKLI